MGMRCTHICEFDKYLEKAITRFRMIKIQIIKTIDGSFLMLPNLYLQKGIFQ